MSGQERGSNRSESRHVVDQIPDSGLDDSGLRNTFAGGAQREMAEGKGRFDLLSPFALEELARHMERGAVKYAPRNWERGIPLSSFVDSAQRHLGDVLKGRTNEPHAVAALWNLHGLVHTQIMIDMGLLPAELDDLPHYMDSESLDTAADSGPPYNGDTTPPLLNTGNN